MNFYSEGISGNPATGSSEVRDWEAFKGRALACFVPALSEPVQESAWAEVKYLGTVYMANLERLRTPSPFTMNYMLRFKSGLLVKATYPSPKHRGRPSENIAARLVCDLRALLIRHHCRHGVSHQDRKKYGSPIEDLAKVVHEMVGEDPRGGWMHMAEMANVNRERAKRVKAIKWRWNLKCGDGAPPPSSTLDESRVWECITSTYEPGTTEP